VKRCEQLWIWRRAGPAQRRVHERTQRYKVSSEAGDIKVYVSDSKGQADCVIHVETVRSGYSNARWFYENSAGVLT